MGNQQGDLYLQTLYALKLGDGTYITQNGKTTHLSYNTINEDYLEYRAKILKSKGFIRRDMGVSGYTGKPIPRLYTRIRPELQDIRETSNMEIIDRLEKVGLLQVILDDGSWHKSKNYYNLYVNSFTKEETEYMADKIYEIYPIKRPSALIERKRDGREFNYLYVPVATSREIRKDLEILLTRENINSMMYKVGK